MTIITQPPLPRIERVALTMPNGIALIDEEKREYLETEEGFTEFLMTLQYRGIGLVRL